MITMNWIRLLRDQTGVTQQTLADLAGTSQPTIALYEAGVKSPTLATMQKLAACLGLDLGVSFTPPMTREDERSLAYHRALAAKLRKEPGPVVGKAKQTLMKLTESQPGARPLLHRWGQWLELPTEALISRILDPGAEAREMRQVTPFAGLLAPKERARILREFRKQYGS
jgi:transcriptional regulator with XRE-family HTH domain